MVRPPDPRATPDSATAQSHELLAREAIVFQRELIRRAVNVRSRLALLCLAMGVVDFIFDALPGSWQLMTGASVAVFLANVMVAIWNRRGDTDARHLWGMQGIDTLTFAILVTSLGEQAYLGIPFMIFAISGYAMGHARAAHVQYAMGVVVYPAARMLAMQTAQVGVSPWLVVIETLVLAVIGWMSMLGPMRFSSRVRRARRALAELERGDFSVRLPTRAHDDVGFLGISFNVTAEALGTTMRALEDEVEERARAEESMRVARLDASRMAARMAAVAEAAAGIIAADSARSLRDVLREACEQVLPLSGFALVLHDARAGTLRVLGTEESGDRSLPVPAHGALRSVLDERRTLVSAGSCPEASASGDGGERSETTMRTPVLLGDEVVATLAITSRTRDAYGAADVAVFEALGALAATALRNILLVEELRSSHEAMSHQAHHDGLTGLANRRRFRERVSAALDAAPTEVAVLALDLDGFKEINDGFGHAAGDRVLQQVAERLLNATRGRDLVARLGGDEFAILLERVPDQAHAVVVADRVLHAVGQPYALGERLVSVGTSIGIAFGHAVHAAPGGEEGERRSTALEEGGRRRSPEEQLLNQADVALYRAKTAGKSCWTIFEGTMRERHAARDALVDDLRSALADGSLQLRVQPVHALRDGGLCGVAAHARWEHRTRGVVPISVWLASAEESGLLVPIGRWLLERACLATARWRRLAARGEEGGVGLWLSVPVTRAQLEDERFADDVQGVLARSGLPAEALHLEVPESAVVHAPPVVRETLTRVRALGVSVVLDDFGTGPAALDYLRDLPVDALKLDRAYVRGVARGGSQTALARTILALGHVLHLTTVAEGVDHEHVAAVLHDLGCTLAQGSLYSPPLTVDACTAYIGAQRPVPAGL